jgi:hypothetical protein
MQRPVVTVTIRLQDDATLFVVGRPAAEGADGFGGEGATPRQGGVTYRMIKFERTTGGGEIVDTSLTTVYSFHDVLRELNSGTRGTWRKASGGHCGLVLRLVDDTLGHAGA